MQGRYIVFLSATLFAVPLAAKPIEGTQGGACFPNQTCDAGLACLKGKCRPVGAEGEACRPDGTCDPALVCNSRQTCEPRPQGILGGDCYGNMTCNKGLDCVVKLSFEAACTRPGDVESCRVLTRHGGAVCADEAAEQAQRAEEAELRAAASRAISANCADAHACKKEGLCGVTLSISVPSGDALTVLRKKCKAGDAWSRGACVSPAEAMNAPMTPLVCQATDRTHCAATSLCQNRGQCTPSGGRCGVGDDADCAQTTACKNRDYCVAGEHRGARACIPDCRNAKVNPDFMGSCQKYGACHARWDDGDWQCVARRNTDCKTSEGCRTSGNCSLVSKGSIRVCGVAKNADCAQSARCRNNGECSYGTYPIAGGGTQRACMTLTNADCRASVLCAQQGKCKAYCPVSRKGFTEVGTWKKENARRGGCSCVD